jgi:hypothetical protein
VGHGMVTALVRPARFEPALFFFLARANLQVLVLFFA